MPRLFKLSAYVLVPLVAAGCAYHYGMPVLMKDRIGGIMGQYGLTSRSVSEVKLNGNNIIYESIRLDQDNFSSIGSVSVTANPIALLTGSPPEKIIIDDLVLTGELADRKIEISGWVPSEMEHFKLYETTVNGAQLDLITPFGGIRLEAKGELKPNTDGHMKMIAALWGIQYQLKIDSRWEGVIEDENNWMLDSKVSGGRLNLEKIKISRLNGWISLSRKEGGTPELIGQLDAGKLQIGNTAGLNNVTLTFEGPMLTPHIIARAEYAAYEDMKITFDIEAGTANKNVKASIETKSLDDLLGFLSDVRTASDDNALPDAILMGLLLTDGNIKRLEGDLKNIRYDRLELAVTGTMYDMSGKIIAKRLKDGAIERHIISLDPGASNL